MNECNDKMETSLLLEREIDLEDLLQAYVQIRSNLATVRLSSYGEAPKPEGEEQH